MTDRLGLDPSADPAPSTAAPALASVPEREAPPDNRGEFTDAGAAPFRYRLANRRFGYSYAIRWRDREFTIRVNCAPDVRPLRAFEIFVEGHRTGSDQAFHFHDDAIALSVMMQTGHRPSYLAARLSRHPGGEPASFFGALVDVAARADQDFAALEAEAAIEAA